MRSQIRQAIRTAVDAHARQRRQAFIDAGELHVCAGCGCDIDLAVYGCDGCWDRRRKRERRADPFYREQQNARDRLTRRRAAA